MRGRVVAFVALCAVAAAVILWLAFGRGGEEPVAHAPVPPPKVTARQVEPAPEIGAETATEAPAAEQQPGDFTADDAPVVQVLDILEALARGTELE